MEKTELHKDIFLIENFLSEKECVSLIEKSEQIGYEEAKVQTGLNTASMIKGIRNNERILYKDGDLATELYNRVIQFLPHKIGKLEICGLNELFRFYKYNPSQRFKMHRDGSYKKNDCEESFFTFLIYLNDDFEGGETEFENLFTIKPKTGSLLLFHHPYRHEGKVLISGTKYCLRSDVIYKIEE